VINRKAKAERILITPYRTSPDHMHTSGQIPKVQRPHDRSNWRDHRGMPAMHEMMSLMDALAPA
jgi:hypothetical protein